MRPDDVEHLLLRDQDVGRGQRLDGAQSEKPRVAGTGTEEGDVPMVGEH
ncbi:hypothetical protein P405_03600 [Streptomyces sp. FR-008]|nr:hypothetical protein P405_03600 [Streptomyces sp. FR-008]